MSNSQRKLCFSGSFVFVCALRFTAERWSGYVNVNQTLVCYQGRRV